MDWNAKYFAAQRFHAAATAANDVLVHLDDDLVPTEAMLQALIDRVAEQPGFPAFAGGRGPSGGLIFGPSGLSRTCSPHGYATWPQRPSAVGGFITFANMMASSKRANDLYLARFRHEFAPALAITRGNGEDITYAMLVARRGAGPSDAHAALVGECAGAGATRQSRDTCATAAGEVIWLRGSLADEARASKSQYHVQPGHYEVRDRLCRCLLGAGAADADGRARTAARAAEAVGADDALVVGEDLARCLSGDLAGGADAGSTSKDEL